MQYATLGATGLVVSRLALGTWTFTAGNQDLPQIYKVDGALADRLVGRALDAGVNLFDTADAYASGEAEMLLGHALKDRRKNAVITTKVGFRNGPELDDVGLSRRNILRSVDLSLKRLGTDWIDLYIAHKEDPFTPLEETLAAFDAVVRSGKVRYVGFSNWSAWKAAAAVEFQRANGLAPFTHGQMYYSLLGRDVEHDVIPMLRHFGLGLTVWSPLAMGFLAGDPDRRYDSFDIFPFEKAFGLKVVEQLRRIAADHDASIAQVALAWLLSKPAVSSIISGITRPEQLDDNIRVTELRLAPEAIVEIDALTAPAPLYPNWHNAKFLDSAMAKALGQRQGRPD
jgi:aryl-alcohol dehydrogenase-like predicted oxidoreductase